MIYPIIVMTYIRKYIFMQMTPSYIDTFSILRINTNCKTIYTG